MIFSDVPVGAKFKVKGFNAEYIKIHNGYFCKNCAELDKDEEQIMFFYFNQYLEVELVTKCVNCKHWADKPRHEHGEINYCHEVSISHIDEENFPSVKLADPETFSCSFFEEKK